MKLIIQVLEKNHEKSSFDCGYEMLNEYIKKQARQDVNGDLSVCFVLVNEENEVKGYYTLSANSIRRDDFPEELRKKMPPSYTKLPTTLLGRLAVDNSLKGQGYGEILLMDALNRTLRTSDNLGILAIVVDPIDDKALNFYSKYGFILLPTSEKMFLAMKTVRDLVG